MKLEDQFTNLELSQKLNIELKSQFVWIKTQKYHLSMRDGINENYHKEDLLNAYTATELLDYLPNTIYIAEREPFSHFRIMITKSFCIIEGKDRPITTYLINYDCTSFSLKEDYLRRQLFDHNIWDSNLANALAKTILKLKEKKYI